MRTTGQFGKNMLVHVVAPDEAKLRGGPSWQLRIEGSGDRWDSQVGYFYYPDVSCAKLCKWVKGQLDWKFLPELVEQFWIGFLPQLQAFYKEYKKVQREPEEEEITAVGRSQT